MLWHYLMLLLLIHLMMIININVDEPEVTKSEKLVLFDNEVDVAFI